MTWGTKGTGPGQFNLVHGVAIDANRGLYVLDRNNLRVQIFDENGKYLDQWPGLQSPTHIEISKDQFAWISDSANNRLLKYDLNGKLLTYWGKSARMPPVLTIRTTLAWTRKATFICGRLQLHDKEVRAESHQPFVFPSADPE